MITGDMNINLLTSADSVVRKYTNILHSFNPIQHISQPTRLHRPPAPEYIQDFVTLPLSIAYAIELPEKLDVLNTLITECINCYTPLCRVKVTLPPAPWMQSTEIRELQAKRNQPRRQAHQDNLMILGCHLGLCVMS
jgi:hypothetical protein